jgi:hypothetical protein
MVKEVLSVKTYIDENNSTDFKGIVIREYSYSATRMSIPTLTATVMYKECLDDYWTGNEYVEFRGEKYFIRQVPTSSKSNDDTRYKHELTLESERNILSNVYFYDIVDGCVLDVNKPVSNNTTFTFYGTISEFADRLNCALKYAGVGDSILNEKVHLTLEDEPTGDGYCAVVGEDGDYDYEESFEFSFEDSFIWDVLESSYETTEIPFEFRGKKIVFGDAPKVLDHEFKYGMNNELLSITKTNSNERIINRVSFLGSSDNIPYYYPNEEEYGEINFSNSNIKVIDEALFHKRLSSTASIVKVSEMVGDASVSGSYNYINGYKLNFGDSYVMGSGGGDLRLTFGITVEEDCYVVVDGVYATFTGRKGGYTRTDNLALQINSGNKPYATTPVISVKYINGDLVREAEVEDGKIICGNLVEGSYFIDIETAWPNISYDIYGGSYLEKIVDDTTEAVIAEPTLTVSQHEKTFYKVGTKRYNSLADLGLEGDIDLNETLSWTYEDMLVIQSNLMPSIYRQTGGKQRFYNAKNNTYKKPDSDEYYTFKNEYQDGKPYEYILSDEDVMPTIEGVKNSQGLLLGQFVDIAYDSDDNDDTQNDTDDDSDVSNYKHSYFYARIPKFDGEYGFNLFEAAAQTGAMTLQMISGACNGCKFKVQIVETAENGVQVFKNPVQVDKNGYIAAGSQSQKISESKFIDSQQDTENNSVWLVLQKDIDTFGVIIPNKANNYKPAVGDKFNIIDIALPNEYIYAAEKKGEELAIKYMAENNEEQFTFDISCSRVFFAKNQDILPEIDENSKIKVVYNGIVYELFITTFEVSCKANESLPEIKFTLEDKFRVSEGFIKSAAAQAADMVASDKAVKAVVDSTVTTKVATTATVSKDYLNKTSNDRTPYKLSSDKAFEVGEFLEGISGGMFGVRDNGQTYIEVDEVTARQAASVPLSEVRVGNAILKWDNDNNALYATRFDGDAVNFYATGGVSALGFGVDNESGGGSDYSRLDSWGEYDSTKADWVLSAALGQDLNTRVKSLEGGSALTFSTSGSGNAVTSISKSGTKVTVTKDATFALTSQIPTKTSQLTNDSNYLTSHQTLYTLTVNKNGSLVGTFNPSKDGTIDINDVASAATLSSHISDDTRHVTTALTDSINTKLEKSVFDDLFEKVNIGTADTPIYAIRAKYGFYSDSFVSAMGADSSNSSGGSDYNRLDAWGEYDSSKADWVLSAALGQNLNSRVATLESGGGMTVANSGNGNAVTSVVKSGTTITVMKGSTFALASDIPTTLPASDVYAWAKASTKPSYTASEISGLGSFAVKSSLAFSELTGKPTTLSGYGITDVYDKATVDERISPLEWIIRNDDKGSLCVTDASEDDYWIRFGYYNDIQGDTRLTEIASDLSLSGDLYLERQYAYIGGAYIYKWLGIYNNGVLKTYYANDFIDWADAADKKHTHDNKSYLDSIDQNLDISAAVEFDSVEAQDLYTSSINGERNENELVFVVGEGLYVRSSYSSTDAFQITFDDGGGDRADEVRCIFPLAANDITADGSATFNAGLYVPSTQSIRLGGCTITYDEDNDTICFDKTIVSSKDVIAKGE